jgi:uncharacterized protein YihD (DUF1040 family)
MKYTLEDFNNITFNGFKFNFPEETLKIISEIALEVGSPNYVKTPVFQKRENSIKIDSVMQDIDKKNIGLNRRRRGNKSIEIVNDDDWETLRTFNTTKIEEKKGIESKIDLLRSNMNKLSDKNYNDIKDKIIENIENIFNDTTDKDEILKIVTIIFEIASTNRFYSKIYADLYTELIKKYEIMMNVFENNFNQFLSLFDVIEYVEPNVDYDKFCKINKDNEKRKALSTFFINLMNNNVITEIKIINIIRNLMNQIYLFINESGKKNEVDELTENIAILYSKKLFRCDKLENNNCKVDYDLIDNMTITEIIEKLAHSKTKNYLSLTTKSIFKFMDLIEM